MTPSIHVSLAQHHKKGQGVWSITTATSKPTTTSPPKTTPIQNQITNPPPKTKSQAHQINQPTPLSHSHPNQLIPMTIKPLKAVETHPQPRSDLQNPPTHTHNSRLAMALARQS